MLCEARSAKLRAFRLQTLAFSGLETSARSSWHGRAARAPIGASAWIATIRRCSYGRPQRAALTRAAYCFNLELILMIASIPGALRALLARGCACLLLFVAASAHADAADTAPQSGGQTALSELLEHAEQHSPALRVARERRGYAAAARAGAEPWLEANPSLGIAVGPRFIGASTSIDVELSLAQPVEIAATRSSRRAVAGELGRRLDAEVALSRLRVRHAVVQAFHSALVARERVTLAERALRFAEEVQSITERRVGAGDATGIELRLSRAEVAAARQSLLLAERDSLTSRLELCDAAGYPPTSPPTVPAGLAPPRPVPPLGALMAELGEKHPELAVRRAAVSEARTRAELADRQAWPVPVLGVELAREGSVGSPTNYIVLGTLQLPLPLWQRNQGERAQWRAEGAFHRAEGDMERHALAVRLARAHGELSSAAARLDVYTGETATALSDTLTLVERGFAAGEIALVELLAARQRLLGVETARLDAYADYYRALADLESASGRDFRVTRGAP